MPSQPHSVKALIKHILDNKVEVLVAMGSQSDWRKGEKDGTWRCCEVLESLGVAYKAAIISAHRTPDRMAQVAKAIDGKVPVVIAAAGGAAHLPGMMAAFMHRTPVIGLPMKSSTLSGVDSLYSIVQMPPGVPVGTMAIGGAENAALFAATIVGLTRKEVQESVSRRRRTIAAGVNYIPE